ncbi:hypothetical protein N7510_007855 [Penicillium lagena]|uniref:uncharacterized protein n=1 Tax=Penicillium lagena TaxID=94218 RepID=UPI0025415228|nr:uncharacterized protein N7510_007855 [Penicillium lagena]KAJ5611136.1 hypothetical protein N7510_007855 [Penicillium lagena]
MLMRISSQEAGHHAFWGTQSRWGGLQLKRKGNRIGRFDPAAHLSLRREFATRKRQTLCSSEGSLVVFHGRDNNPNQSAGHGTHKYSDPCWSMWLTPVRVNQCRDIPCTGFDSLRARQTVEMHQLPFGGAAAGVGLNSATVRVGAEGGNQLCCQHGHAETPARFKSDRIPTLSGQFHNSEVIIGA